MKWMITALALMAVVAAFAIFLWAAPAAAAADRPEGMEEWNWMPISDELGLSVGMRASQLGQGPPSLPGSFWAKRDGTWHPVHLEQTEMYIRPAQH